MLNLSIPQLAADAARKPTTGVGLMRAEFLALNAGQHPGLMLEESGADSYIDFFADGIREVASKFFPRPVRYRTLDLKTHEYRGLRGGDRFETVESNPTIGNRGVFRYLSNPAELQLELEAVMKVRAEGFTNVQVMVPFVRSERDLEDLRVIIDKTGLPGEDGFELWAMAEVPASAFRARHFAAYVDGMSIGSNDLVQLILGADRDTSDLQSRYTSSDPAVLEAIQMIIEGTHEAGKATSICGDQAPRDKALLETLVRCRVGTVSVVSQAVDETAALLHEFAQAGLDR